MNKTYIKKGLAAAVIVLFLGVAIAPSINADLEQVSANIELVEVTTDVCGINGVKPHTVKLTQEEATELDNLLKDIESRLNKSKSREETVAIFNDAIVSLDEFGLLGDLSVEVAQRLVFRGYRNPRAMGLLEKVYSRNLQGREGNFLCLISGKTNNSITIGPFSLVSILFAVGIAGLIFNLVPSFLLEKLGITLNDFVSIVGYIILLFPSFILPVELGGIMVIGQTLSARGKTLYYPSQGWIWSLGLNGVKNWSGPFYGLLRSIPITGGYDVRTYYLGVTGFTGLEISSGTGWKGEGITYFLGSALRVCVSKKFSN